MKPLIDYFVNAKKSSGLTAGQICNKMAALTGKRYMFDRHALSRVQWAMPTKEQYSAAQTFLPLHRSYEDVKNEYRILLSKRLKNTTQKRFFKAIKNNCSTILFYKPCMAGSKIRIHPTQKPLELIRDIITTTCPEGGWILDPFGGGGTTAVAAIQTSRKCVIIEKKLDYCQKIVERLKNLS